MKSDIEKLIKDYDFASALIERAKNKRECVSSRMHDYFNPIVEALGLKKFHGTVHYIDYKDGDTAVAVTYVDYFRGDRDSNTVDIPLFIIEAADPLQAAIDAAARLEKAMAEHKRKTEIAEAKRILQKHGEQTP